MPRTKSLLLNFLVIAGLNGCGAQSFPQYSGNYKLVAYSYNDESFKGSKNLPSKLKLTDRMEFRSSYWKHYLRFNFLAANADEAQGNVLVPLQDLVYKNQYAYPNERPDGAALWSEEKVDGGAFCYFQYTYTLYMEPVPEAEILKNVYKTHGDYGYIDPITGVKIVERLKDPGNAGFNDEAFSAWYDSLNINNGITLMLKFSRNLESDLTGCNDNNYLVYDEKNRGNADLVLIYKSTFEDQSTDVRKAGVDEAFEGTGSAKPFFREIVSGIE